MAALLRAGIVLCLFFSITGTTRGEDQPPVKVFILAGQSNMQGHGEIVANPDRNGGQGTFEYIVKNAPADSPLRFWKQTEGQWNSREDVQIWYLGRMGNLAPGFGAKEHLIGPELGFGQVVGDAYKTPVLLIKICWGGKSLAKDFRPPSSGGEVGPYYRDLIKLSNEVLEGADKMFPQFAGRKMELAGFGWHQGWNDRVNQGYNDEYEQNMANFIRDIRKEFKSPDLPFVLAETGMSGFEEKHPRALSLMKAQAAVAKHKEFQGNVAFVGTKAFFRPKEKSPSGQAFHWNRNAETYYLIGEGMGKAMLKLLSKK